MKRTTTILLLLSLFLLACGTFSPIANPSSPVSTDLPATADAPTPAPSPTSAFPPCGNGVCEFPENTASCPADCTPGADGFDPQLVPFPADSPATKHAFYPLVGQHAQLGCDTCHATGQYNGTPNTCGGCHSAIVPINHFAGDCIACHVPDGWQIATFDHQLAGATNCLTCHTDDAPLNHFTGDCAACHLTVAWQPATFDHQLAGATDCLACHTNSAPANHYAGQCSNCHFSTTTWTGASYPHTFPTSHGGANNNCASCHPVTTATWTCSVCHADAAMLNEHKEEGINNIANCLQCHPTGTEGHEGGGDDD